ncbi:MAG: SufD family Fe-S cluster assembly protein, partial [Rickettsiales bacterium]|nr:SufD family Fe-S cluster assembly protein [Rickettsiales bacterium]
RFGNLGAVSAGKGDNKIIGKSARANTVPSFIGAEGNFTHEATTGVLDKNSMLYLRAAGINEFDAAALLVAGMAEGVLSRLPMEFLVESKQLISFAMSN